MSRRPLVPEAKDKLDKLKTEYANEFRVKFNDEYKGNQTSKLNGYTGGPIGGLMTKKMIEAVEKRMINK
ncbi:alpha/beta-type small acid-soluble spore protein [Clostridium botulinum]|uniref:alpha/beta-type small acid-soluble spore protein n=1 Tax=Clostridium botulinum TaxID=1491 RepID=UPI001E31DE20|nr:alpha/beta-type small acid-soluble spore protein [Clostridium botulinum]MCD3252562.1 alpha/beta-type small acid-soluble spore protein [Clostridium botulinum C/D]MCD3278888.1 alpha/beta-type small acid-soluble spore protein [Clostridium botulinum C/D]MCD3280851.1 alpha/beta-type small acid-soluble spore protein [Clostridium botulinum C/D]MCD3337756.1 alpha/beta-type small acid-soluble spore protein [Clostridium botulinum C/D]MCD3355557.1 alpha/beta-type small acid-soluble spore protein [Clos